MLTDVLLCLAILSTILFVGLLAYVAALIAQDTKDRITDVTMLLSILFIIMCGFWIAYGGKYDAPLTCPCAAKEPK